MNAELEAILKAYEAFLEAADDSVADRLWAVYESRLDDVIEQHPRVSKESLHRAVKSQYRAWVAKQKKPPTLPPAA